MYKNFIHSLLFSSCLKMNEFTNKDFDVKKYILTKFKHSNVNDLNSYLTFLNKSIAKHNMEAKDLVSKHFDKFIECRSVIEAIKSHMLEQTNLGQLNTSTLKSFDKIEIEEYDTFRRKDEIKQRFSNLFRLKERLNEATSYDEFVNLCVKSFDELQKCKESKYLQLLFNETEKERKEMLDKLSIEIEGKEQNLDDTLHFFDLYFKLEEINDESIKANEKNSTNLSIQNQFTVKNTQKMENTILVNSKYKLEEIFSKNDVLSAIDSAKPILFKLLEYNFSARIKEDVLNTFVVHLTRKLTVERYDNLLYRIITKEINAFIVFASKNVTTSEKYKFIDKTNVLKNTMIENILYEMLGNKNSIKDFCRIFTERIQECFWIKNNLKDEHVKNKIKDVLNDRITNVYSFEDVFYIKNVFINKLRDITESEMSDMEEFYTLIRKHEDDELRVIIDVYQNELYAISSAKYNDKTDLQQQEIIIPAMMMKIFKIIHKYPKSCKAIINELFHSLNNNVCKYFLKDLCNQEIELTNNEKMLFYKFNKAYGILLHNNEARDMQAKDEPKLKKLVHLEEFDKEGKFRMDKKEAEGSNM